MFVFVSVNTARRLDCFKILDTNSELPKPEARAELYSENLKEEIT